MASQALNTIDESWASAQYNHRVANLAWSAVELEDSCPARERAAENLAEARNLLFSAPAPDLGGVIEKLSIWYGESLWDDSYESSQVRRLIGDLRRFQMEAAGADEVEASGRSPEEATEQADEWREALAEYNEHQLLLVEGPSPRWEGRNANDIYDGLDHAEGRLLDLPAPTPHGAIRKLELLWETDRYETVEAGAFCQYAIWDLNRLSSSGLKDLADRQ